MRSPRFLIFFGLFIAAGLPAPAHAASVAINSDKPLSERVVAYSIDARLDSQHKSLDATETLTYHNLTGQAQDTFPFHLYLNAFQPKSTFMREVRRDHSSFEWEDKYRASAEVKSLQVTGIGDLTSQIHFIAPDDGNSDDRTVFQVKLPKPVKSGDSVEFKIEFHDQFGEVFARTGYKRDFIMGAQWFPKVGVWWQGAWNCHQFHGNTEFFADFGTFDVRLTVPQNEVVGASGVEVASVRNSDGTKTLTFRGEDIHDFAWTVEPQYQVFTDTFNGSMGPVKMRLLMQPGHVNQADRHMTILRQTLEHFDRWYGPYPYKQITMVDPPHGALRAGGMEYPTLFTADTTWWMPKGVHFVELVAEHEFGHQYWYGMVATNEFENAWLDEGINSYTECKILDDIFGKDYSAFQLWGMHESDDYQQRNSYRDAADDDPMARFGWQYMNGGSYGDITYGKTATVLLTLEKVIGEQTLQNALRTYFMRYRFTHPTQEDFLKTVEEVSGQNLRWYYDQAVYGTAVLDYDIAKASSDRLAWFEKKPQPEKKGQTLYRTQVIVHRKGDFIFPLDVLMKFDDGENVREHWDGRDRWIRYMYDKKAKLVSAEIDPGTAVRLDKDYFNNSYVAESDHRASHNLTHYWGVFVQFLSQVMAWLT
ncbi:MAG TPA: M1 family metallopeptidase [Terriglobales bacterium]|nr:M1 family metallopeptidase [Terriglobales bacterium]